MPLKDSQCLCGVPKYAAPSATSARQSEISGGTLRESPQPGLARAGEIDESRGNSVSTQRKTTPLEGGVVLARSYQSKLGDTVWLVIV